MFFKEILDLKLFLETLLISANQNSFCWQSVICHIANNAFIYPQILQKNTDLWSWVELLKSADKQLVQAQKQVQQSIRKKRIYKQNIDTLTEQLYWAHVNDILKISYVAKLAAHPNLAKFNNDKTKLKTFFTQLNLKL